MLRQTVGNRSSHNFRFLSTYLRGVLHTGRYLSHPSQVLVDFKNFINSLSGDVKVMICVVPNMLSQPESNRPIKSLRIEHQGRIYSPCPSESLLSGHPVVPIMSCNKVIILD